ncbi:hypothetical protein CQA53_08490 [Helicobacter didelphidarum]|uniref:ATP synthase subunit b n=1 Tax=Helicobacter didelphidarum TaxID=2040648 RepID=A0A3D8IE56_9HELI|nr:hypothetical protein [Helicobacter didelphidarum]RDU63449.1 hypothetical protein CQA53_08490 [Helicobacter didelphidarum]
MRYVFVVFSMFVLTCSVLYASEHVMDISKTDIFQRTINFAIFVGIMWYLVADKLKAMLQQRTRAISEKLTQAQAKVKESREKKEKAQQRLKNAYDQVPEIIKSAKQEANIAVQNIEEKTKDHIVNLIKANEEAMEFQKKLFQKQIVEEILHEIFVSPTLKLETQDYVGILEKKVA